MTGSIHWLELNTQRIHEAQRFYVDAFLWSTPPLHFSPFGLMSKFSNQGHEFANGFMAMGAFAPSQWHTYISGDVELAIKKAKEGGGKVFGDISRHDGWSVNITLEDPEGNGFRIIEMETPPTFTEIPAGHPYCAELWADDAKKMADFYGEVLGIPAKKTSRGWTLGQYLMIRNNPFSRPTSPWIPYFRSVGLGADQRRVELFGSIPQVPKEKVRGIGEIAIYSDPTGALFGLIET